MTDKHRRAPGWQLDHRGPAAYEEYLVPGMFAPWAERLIDRVDLGTGDRVLDLACGTGIVARRVAARFGSAGTIVGVDVNKAMLAEARAAAESYPQIEWRQADATALPFPDDHVDVVFCQQALQFVEDPTRALTEVSRVLVPGGRLAASVWRPLTFNPGYVALADAFERHVDEDAAAMMRSPFPAWDGDDLRSLARDGGFGDVSVTIEIGSMRYPSVAEFVRREAASSPLAEPLAAIDPEVQERLVDAVRDALADYRDDDGLVFPMESHVVTARRSP